MATESLIPQRGQGYRPPKDRQREILTQMRDNWRDQGFQAEMNAVAAEEQTGEDEDGKTVEERKATWQIKADNCYGSARKMDEELEKLGPGKGPRLLKSKDSPKSVAVPSASVVSESARDGARVDDELRVDDEKRS